MTERELREYLEEVLFMDEDEKLTKIESVRSFKEAGVLSVNEGVVVKTKDGSTFQLTIVRSR